MATGELSSPPRMLPLYARTVAPLLPGASLLPLVGGRGGELPELKLTLRRCTSIPHRLAAYAHVCGFSLRDALPATYPHVLAFPLHLALMSDRQLPIRRRSASSISPTASSSTARSSWARHCELRVRTSRCRAIRGADFALLTAVRIDEELVWEDHSTMLRRGASRHGEGAGGAGEGAGEEGAGEGEEARAQHRGHSRGAAADPAAERGLAPARRPRPPLRGGCRGSQPDPPVRAQRKTVRFPARDRAWDVDQGTLPGRTRAALPDRFASRSASAGRSCYRARSRSGVSRGRRNPLRRNRQAAAGEDETRHLDGRIEPLDGAPPIIREERQSTR